MKLVEFLTSQGLERHVHALVRSNLLTYEELCGSSETLIDALRLSPRDMMTLKKALGRKTEEPQSLSIPDSKQPLVKPEKHPVVAEEKNPARPGRIRNLKPLYLISCFLVLIGSVVFLALFMNQELPYPSEKIFRMLKRRETSKPLVPATLKQESVLQTKDQTPDFSGFITRYQEALKRQDPSEIASFFMPDGLIEYYQKRISRAELLDLLESERLNEPILIRSVEYGGTIHPPAGSEPEMKWAQLSLQYETKKGKYEKKICVGVVANTNIGMAISSESNEQNPVQLDSPTSSASDNVPRVVPFSSVAWIDPGPLLPGKAHQLELVFYGVKPTEQWRFPPVLKLQILGQPTISHSFHQGRTDLKLLFSIRLEDSGEVRIPSFQVMTDKGPVDVPGLILNATSQTDGSGSRSEQNRGRGLPAKRKSQDNKEVLAELKDFYSPADVFPEKKIGLRIVGKFIVLRFSNGGNYLSSDESRGEKNAVRRFVPENCNLPLGGRYTFTPEAPLVISSVSLFGQYGVLVPSGLQPDRY